VGKGRGSGGLDVHHGVSFDVRVYAMNELVEDRSGDF
jgi:hypothetical protein